MIPKVIHYCWFGHNPLPEFARKCIDSWKRYLPDYEIRRWDEDNFDVYSIPYTKEAYRLKKYAFVSDYARFLILYKQGGLYFDTDVEVIRSMDDIIARGNFMGFEMDPDGKNTPGRYAPRYCFDVALGLGFGIEKEHPFMQKMMDYYANMEFNGAVLNPWFKTIVAYTTEELMREGLENVAGIQQVGDITIYPREYFAPINVISGRLHITPNTRTIHHYMGSWTDSNKKSIKKRLESFLPESFFFILNRIQRSRYKIR
jgi:mannosyltransferase OCH1-like enzyme